MSNINLGISGDGNSNITQKNTIKISVGKRIFFISIIVSLAVFGIVAYVFNSPQHQIVGVWYDEFGRVAAAFNSNGTIDDEYGLPCNYHISGNRLTISRVVTGYQESHTFKIVGNLMYIDEEVWTKNEPPANPRPLSEIPLPKP